MRASLFVTTYDMPRHLELVLTGLARQSMTDFELLLCDDGSGSETAEMIQRFQEAAPFPVVHVWQPHEGFRKCRILNEGLRRSAAETLIFLDGDCVPHRDFVRDHVDLAGAWIAHALEPACDPVGAGIVGGERDLVGAAKALQHVGKVLAAELHVVGGVARQLVLNERHAELARYVTRRAGQQLQNAEVDSTVWGSITFRSQGV